MSFLRYPAYKPSGVEWLGEVPEHWEALPLRRLIREVTSGTSVNAIDEPASPGQPGVLKTSCVYTGEFRPEENKAILESELDRATCPLVAGSLVVSRMNTPDLVGAAGLVKNNDPFLFLPDRLWQVRFQGCHPRFINHWCKSVSYRCQVQLACSGTSSSMQNLSQDSFYSFISPLPPAHEQLAIATFLDRETAKIDALIAEQQRLIELLQEKRQAVISHTVTKGLNPDAPMKDSGVEWLGEVPEHWRTKRIKHLCAYIEQGWSPQCENESSDGDAPGVLKVGCVNGGIFRPSENKRLPADLSPIAQYSVRRGDLLVSRANTKELVGSAAVAGKDYPWLYICDKLYRITVMPGKVTSNYLALYLASNEARGQVELGASGASHSMQNISQSVLMEMPIPLPELDEQERIINEVADQCSLIDRLRTNATEAIGLFQERRSALISAAVTGQIDVRGLVPEAEAA